MALEANWKWGAIDLKKEKKAKPPPVPTPMICWWSKYNKFYCVSGVCVFINCKLVTSQSDITITKSIVTIMSIYIITRMPHFNFCWPVTGWRPTLGSCIKPCISCPRRKLWWGIDVENCPAVFSIFQAPSLLPSTVKSSTKATMV